MIPMPSSDLVQRYGRPGPRYTSYPPANEWDDAFAAADLERHLVKANAVNEPVSIYVHLPFCPEMCRFCGCNVIATRDRNRGDDYLDVLEQEVALWAARLPDRRSMSQLHLGGGTPTFLRPAQLQRLWEILTRHFKPTADAELAVEVDPAITTEEQLKLLGGLGFNRISMGIQDLDPKVQQAINRIQTAEATEATMSQARAAGFGSVNVDLIYGLPHQTPENFANTVDRVLQMSPDRIALFGYAHVPWLKPHQRLLPEAYLPGAMARVGLFVAASHAMEAAGYEQIGLDHFARAGDALTQGKKDGTLTRNFQGYAVHAANDTIAFGVSSISDVGGAFSQNFHKLSDWEEAVKRGAFPVERGLSRSADDEVRGALIRQLMCLMRLERSWVASELGAAGEAVYEEAVVRLEPLSQDGLLILRDDGLDVTELGRLFLRNIAMTFDAKQFEEVPVKKAFSQTV